MANRLGRPVSETRHQKCFRVSACDRSFQRYCLKGLKAVAGRMAGIVFDQRNFNDGSTGAGMTKSGKLVSKLFNVRRAAGTATLALLLLGGAFSGAAQAASFHCGKKVSSSEKLVCNDPELSSLDDKLAIAYKRAKDVTPDTAAFEDDRVKQWQWRQHNCKDKACVINWYNRRISELDADFDQGTENQVTVLKASLAEQNLAPPAQAAVLRMKGDAGSLSMQ